MQRGGPAEELSCNSVVQGLWERCAERGRRALPRSLATVGGGCGAEWQRLWRRVRDRWAGRAAMGGRLAAVLRARNGSPWGRSGWQGCALPRAAARHMGVPEFESGLPRLALAGTPAEGSFRMQRDGRAGGGRLLGQGPLAPMFARADFQVGLEEKKDAER